MCIDHENHGQPHARDDLSRGPLADWPPPDSSLRSDWSVESYRREFDQLDFEGCVLVETSRLWENDLWLLALAQSHPSVLGVVANLQPDLEGFVQRFARARASTKFIGVRLRPIDQYDFSSPHFPRSLQQLEAEGCTVEFGVKTSMQKRSFANLAAAFSGTSFVLDHGGHPDSQSAADSEWLDGMEQIAALPNVFCKLTSAFGAAITMPSLFEFLLQKLGRMRLLFGSNWPVSELSSPIEDIVSDFRKVLGDDTGFFSENARSAYQIGSSCVSSGR